MSCIYHVETILHFLSNVYGDSMGHLPGKTSAVLTDLQSGSTLEEDSSLSFGSERARRKDNTQIFHKGPKTPMALQKSLKVQKGSLFPSRNDNFHACQLHSLAARDYNKNSLFNINGY